ncbi:hypothetical protein ACLOJK_002808 [Asimina triloba]
MAQPVRVNVHSAGGRRQDVVKPRDLVSRHHYHSPSACGLIRQTQSDTTMIVMMAVPSCRPMPSVFRGRTRISSPEWGQSMGRKARVDRTTESFSRRASHA